MIRETIGNECDRVVRCCAATLHASCCDRAVLFATRTENHALFRENAGGDVHAETVGDTSLERNARGSPFTGGVFLPSREFLLFQRSPRGSRNYSSHVVVVQRSARSSSGIALLASMRWLPRFEPYLSFARHNELCLGTCEISLQIGNNSVHILPHRVRKGVTRRA